MAILAVLLLAFAPTRAATSPSLVSGPGANHGSIALVSSPLALSPCAPPNTSPPAVPGCPWPLGQSEACLAECRAQWEARRDAITAACDVCHAEWDDHLAADIGVCAALYGPGAPFPDPIAQAQCEDDAQAEAAAGKTECATDAVAARGKSDKKFRRCCQSCCY